MQLAEMRDVVFGYGHVPVLEGLNLTIGSGEFIGLTGGQPMRRGSWQTGMMMARRSESQTLCWRGGMRLRRAIRSPHALSTRTRLNMTHGAAGTETPISM